MKCPNCGYEHELNIAKGKLFRQALLDRLSEYGFPEPMSPKKSRAMDCLRNMIKIRGGLTLKTGGSLSEKDYKEGLIILDLILPPKNTNGE